MITSCYDPAVPRDVVDAVEVIALVIVAALVSGNDRVALIVDGVDHVHGTDPVPERGYDQGAANDQTKIKRV